MVATVAVPFESLPVKRRKLQSEQQKRRSRQTASVPSSDDEEIVVTVEDEEEREQHPKRRRHGRSLPPGNDELPLDLSSKKAPSSVKLFQPTLPTSASLWPHPSALMTSAVPLFFSFYPAWSTLPYLYAAAPFAGSVLSPVNALNTRHQLPTTVSSSPDISPKSSLLSSASPSSPSSSPSSPPSLLADSTTAATKHRKARNPVVRRMVANARERCRVHMISEAFEALRVALPSACPAQKLTKVSILRIACDYIMLLGAMNGRDYSADQRSPSVDELRRQLSETILAETNFKCV
ncbi:HLH domain containing protein [Trichuris trichiura]|uniref:HLH domain containing protein n=1 Tax=Trichuris trichiura TaxID=36087 RepID=A0A077YZ32_TRITR|nr:HLH domain containing protein [Trichuris trichiura]